MVKKSKSKKIVIDEQRDLVFDSEEELYAHFSEDIFKLEEVLFKQRRDFDIDEKSFVSYEGNLNLLLEDPDEIWEDDSSLKSEVPAATFIKCISKKENLYHVAIVYLTDNVSSFVYLHFPTKDSMLVEFYKRGELVFDECIKNAPPGAIEGDALLEGDELALRCYQAMFSLRTLGDILEENFLEYASLREKTIEEPDEVWRRNDSLGNVLVSFVKDFNDKEKNLYYIVLTVEDMPSNSHALLFSFPTTDKSLVDRYSLGQNLQADEVVRESSH